jgi:hypothetical protein
MGDFERIPGFGDETLARLTFPHQAALCMVSKVSGLPVNDILTLAL